MNEHTQFNLNCMVNKSKDIKSDLNQLYEQIAFLEQSNDFDDLLSIENILTRIERNVEDLRLRYDRANETWE